MKKALLLLVLLNGAVMRLWAQTNPYQTAMAAYQRKDYHAAALLFNPYFAAKGEALTSTQLYDGACILALDGQQDAALSALHILAEKRYFSSLNRISTDSDLSSLHGLPEWNKLLEKVAENQRTEPGRNALKVKAAFSQAKALLMEDNGRLWGKPLWSDSLLALDPQHRVYSMEALAGAQNSSGIWIAQAGERELNQSNAPQVYQGKSYAVILTSYLADSSATIIHELFHLKQQHDISLNGNPVNYLDDYEARQLLRLEYQALRDALAMADKGKSKNSVTANLRDAILFRTLRQSQHSQSTKDEIEIESSEGLANYTGFVLSAYRNKYDLAIRELNSREQAPTYTRAFPYATGPAYGLLFDYLGIHWRTGLNHAYNFTAIFRQANLGRISASDTATFKPAAKRHKYTDIHDQELKRKAAIDQKINYLTQEFTQKPVLRVKLADPNYNRSFDMYGTTVLEGIGMVYGSITGTDINGKNFGSFKTTTTGTEDQPAGVLASFDNMVFRFSLPLKIEGNKLTGSNYELVLNPGWAVRKTDNQGNLEIIKE
ncbi:hypothetical protein HH214_18525 [Mucilaginibacter robiniae]|uniref:Tetratricopeptide repeat protein n=1 Tax=Mucilaginibacter robiniae TaxID=2728022 RepID=A0A7L5E5R1_9SPHI|nr:hypothetical protein [Mucilaginibacter robiniae]QJD97727.1 hypothetical protein HH214_18525 [Mucilaginibacter robiniae]